MSNPMDKHIQDFTRALVILSAEYVIADQIIGFCEARGVDTVLFCNTFMQKHPAWGDMPKYKGLRLNNRSAHARLAWAATAQREGGV